MRKLLLLFLLYAIAIGNCAAQQGTPPGAYGSGVSSGGGATVTCSTVNGFIYWLTSSTQACDSGITTNTTGTLSVTGQYLGEASGLAYSFTGDTTTGIYHLAAGAIAVEKAGFLSHAFNYDTYGQFKLDPAGTLAWGPTANTVNGTPDTGLSRLAAGVMGLGTGAANSTAGYIKSTAMTATTAADVTCGTGGTITTCTAATTIPGLTFTLPLVAATWHMDCELIVGQATAATANQWLIQTATNGATSTTAGYMMNTAATATAGGAVTDQASTTTAFQITPSWTLGAIGTKMPVHIWATVTGASASGTVLNLQVIAPTVADLLTIYEGSACTVK